jgi:uncharacterized protein (TIGR03546 family)
MAFVLIQLVNRFLKLLNSETKPSQLAAGFCFGLIVGLSPFFAWHNLVVFLLVCLFRVNLSLFFGSWALFGLLGFFLDPLFDWFGFLLLAEVEALRPLWIWFSATPLLPYFRFNNTVLIGSLSVALILFPLLFPSLVLVIKQYRRRWRQQILQSRFFKILRASKFYKIYTQLDGARNAWRRWSA